MARPTTISLLKSQQKSVMSAFKKGLNVRSIAQNLGVSRYQVMAFLESQKLVKYSEGSYN